MDDIPSERCRVLLVFKHVFGHHVSHAEAFVDLFSDWGWEIHVLAIPELERVAPNLPFLKRVTRTELVPLQRRPLSTLHRIERYCQAHAIDLVVLVTLDEWLVDLALHRALRRRSLRFRLFGILHHLSKSGGILRRIQGALALHGWKGVDRSITNLRVGCLTDESQQLAQGLNPRVPVDKIAYVHKIHREPLARSILPDDEGIRLLIFGALRSNKRILEVIQGLKQAAADTQGPRLELTLAGRFSDDTYARRVRQSVEAHTNGEPSNLTVCLQEGFISDDEKRDLFARTHIVVISNSGGDFEGRMISGVLLDAVHFRRPIVCTDSFPLPQEVAGVSAQYNLAQPTSLATAITEVISHYDEFVTAYDVLGDRLIDGFKVCLREQVRELTDHS